MQKDPTTGKRLPSGVVVRRSGLLVYAAVTVNGKRVQRSEMKPHGTHADEIVKWQAEERERIRAEKPAAGTLAGDIETYVESLVGRRQLDARGRLKPWAEALGPTPRAKVTTADIRAQLEAWRTARRYQGPTLNRMRQELISLWRTLDGKRHACPAVEIEKYPEHTPRQGFFEQAQFEKVLEHLPEHYADVARFAAFSGWRREEVEGLLWSEVDTEGGVIRLSPERSKTKDGRVLPIVGPLVDVMKRRTAQRNDLALVFTRTLKESGKHVPVGDWRKTWKAACVAAGCPNAMMHDFRRTVVRNLTRARVPEKVAMAWTGHKTRSVFDRYNIVDEQDLQAAGERLAAFIRQ
jgi:integrase